MNSVSWSPTHNLLISGSDDTSVKVWTADDTKLGFNPGKPIVIKMKNERNRIGDDNDSE